MKQKQKKAVILKLVESLQERGSWCGETHIQKATYCLQELTSIPLEFNFILYKHGPFSFDLRDELTAMRAYGFLDIRLNPYPYGPSLCITKLAKALIQDFPKTLNKFNKKIGFVAETLGEKGVAELERLATAIDERANTIHKLKPHVSIEDANAASRDMDMILSRAAKI
jgi:hypothetical protein